PPIATAAAKMSPSGADTIAASSNAINSATMSTSVGSQLARRNRSMMAGGAFGWNRALTVSIVLTPDGATFGGAAATTPAFILASRLSGRALASNGTRLTMRPVGRVSRRIVVDVAAVDTGLWLT